jgi:hypothetical protein
MFFVSVGAGLDLSLEVAMAATAAQFDIRLKRAYAPRSASDGTRILIDSALAARRD